MARRPTPREPARRIDLHGLAPEAALRRLAQELHACRLLRLPDALVVTGRGLGNPQGRAVLRERVEAWLAGPEGRRLGVRSWERDGFGGALRLRLGGGA